MKITGIIRRIDDLGRVIIPKDIRRQLKLHEGDPLEVCIGEDYVAFKKVREEDACAICGMTTCNVLLERFVCHDCISAIKDS